MRNFRFRKKLPQKATIFAKPKTTNKPALKAKKESSIDSEHHNKQPCKVTKTDSKRQKS